MGTWSDDDIETLKRMWADGASLKEIGEVVGKTPGCVGPKRRALGLPNCRVFNGRRKLFSEHVCPKCDILLKALAESFNKGDPCYRQECPFKSYQLSIFKPEKETSNVL